MPVIASSEEGLAGVQGFEPRFYGPEPHVLPLDDTPTDVRAASRRVVRRLAERGGFEPPVGLLLRRFSKPVP